MPLLAAAVVEEEAEKPLREWITTMKPEKATERPMQERANPVRPAGDLFVY
jgi:hypothetical protein